MIVVVSGKALSATTVFFGIATDCKEEQPLNALPPIIFVPSLILNNVKLFGMLISFEPSFGYVASFAHLSIITLYLHCAFIWQRYEIYNSAISSSDKPVISAMSSTG